MIDAQKLIALADAAEQAHEAWLNTEDVGIAGRRLNDADYHATAVLQGELTPAVVKELAQAYEERDALRADAERYRFLRNNTYGDRSYGVQQFVLPTVDPLTDIMRGSVAEHLDNAIDEAIAARAALSGGKP